MASAGVWATARQAGQSEPTAHRTMAAASVGAIERGVGRKTRKSPICGMLLNEKDAT